MPSQNEIKVVVFNMNNRGAPEPNGFGALSFQTLWDIVSKDVIDVTLHFFFQNWMMPNMNASIVVLIPKVDNANTISQFKQMTMVISKPKSSLKFLQINSPLSFLLSPLKSNILGGV